MTVQQVTVWVVVDEDGNYECGLDGEGAAERLAENAGGNLGELGVRRIKVVLTVPLPEVVTLTGEVPAEGEVGLRVA